MRYRHLSWSLPVVLVCGLAQAQSGDPAAARAQLQEGYALKQKGKCEAAIPHFMESVRLDRQPKALLNLADCEEKLGKLATALSHFVEARDLAQSQRLSQLQTLADQRRQSIEKKVPRLTVKLAKDAPPGTAVSRDGVELGTVSLNTALPADPGKHVIVARSTRFEHVYDVTIAESESKEIEVTPTGGRPLPRASTQPTTSEPAPAAATGSLTTKPARSAPAPSTPPPTGLGGQRIAALITGGVGVLATGVGGYYALRAKSTYKGADCDAFHGCSVQGLTDQNLAYAQARNSTIATVGGVAAIAAGIVLWVTAPSSPSTDAATAAPRNRLWVSVDPLGDSGARSVSVGGVF